MSSLIRKSPALRRLAWRLGRHIYMAARGEASGSLPASSGEVYLQARMASALYGMSGATVLDVGANLGQWSVQLHRCLSEAGGAPTALRHLAFEPSPATQRALRSTLDAAGLADRVEIVPMALSNTEGEAVMHLHSPTSGRNSLVPDSAAPAMRTITVPTQTLDAFCACVGIDHVNLLKIDAEGHDFDILLGAQGLIAAAVIDVIQFEYSKHWIDSRRFLKDVFAMIEGTPYALYRILPDRLEVLPAWHIELDRFFLANYVLLHPRAQGWFDLYQGYFDKSATYA